MVTAKPTAAKKTSIYPLNFRLMHSSLSLQESTFQNQNVNT